MNVLEPPFFFTFHLKRALFEFSSLPLSFSLFSSSSFFSKLAQARSPQLDVRLRPAPPRHRRLDRAVGLRGRDVNVVVELFVVSFFLSDFGGERGVSEEKKKKTLSLSKKKKKKTHTQKKKKKKKKPTVLLTGAQGRKCRFGSLRCTDSAFGTAPSSPFPISNSVNCSEGEYTPPDAGPKNAAPSAASAFS